LTSFRAIKFCNATPGLDHEIQLIKPAGGAT
jgi:hypothetical protein